MKTDVLSGPDIVDNMVNSLFEGMGAFNVKVRLSSADMNPVEGTLSYNVEDVVIETKGGSARVSDGGVLELDVNPDELAEKLQSKTSGEAVEIVDLRVEDPPDDFNYGRNKADYTLTASYLTKDGANKNVELKFNSVAFTPSEEFTEQMYKLT